MRKIKFSKGRRTTLAVLATVVMGFLAVAQPVTASAEPGRTGGRFTFLRDDGSYWGASFAGAGYGEIPFAIDTNGDGKQELAVYYRGRFTVRRDDGSYWGVTIPGGGFGEVPLAIDTNGDGRQEFAVYYQGRFTMMRDDGSLWGVTFAGSTREEIPLAIDTNGDGIQEFAVYRDGRFTFMRSDGSQWGVTFAGASANEVPLAIDWDGDRVQDLAVYRDGRFTIRRPDGSYWGVTFQGAGLDEMPLAIDTDGNRRQEFTVYNHTPVQLLAKQILANSRITKSGRVVTEDLQQTADGQFAVSNSYLSASILRALVRVGYSHTISISSLTGNGTGHSSGSRHYTGLAADLNVIDGRNSVNSYPRLTGRDSNSLAIIPLIEQELPPGSRFGQANCGPGAEPAWPSGFSGIQDTCDHLHFDAPYLGDFG